MPNEKGRGGFQEASESDPSARSINSFACRSASRPHPINTFGAQASGNADKFKGFAEECMAEYDLDGWKVPDLSDPGELSYHVMRGVT